MLPEYPLIPNAVKSLQVKFLCRHNSQREDKYSPILL